MLSFTPKRLIVVIVLGICAAAAQSIRATNYTVTSTGDFSISGGVNNGNGVITGGTGNGLVTLRSAIFAADTSGGGPHTVILGSNTYNVSLGQMVFGTKAENITIQGNGSASTIINMTGTGVNQTRFFFINDDGAKVNVVISVTGIKFQNGFANIANDAFGGAAIISGGGTGNSLTLTNCDFTNNVVPHDASVNGPGGAVNNIVSGDLIINNCTFNNNKNFDNEGGAVYFFIFNATVAGGNPHYAGHLTITNSTFTGNTAGSTGSVNGGALSFSAQGRGDAQVITDFSADVHNNTFTGNTATGFGGAIAANNSFGAPVANIKINFNRIVGNTSAANAITSGMLFVNSQGSVNAASNWWGCNSNPVNAVSTAPCNQANGIGASGGGSLTASPWLQLKTTNSPTPIVTNQTTTVTSGFLTDSNNGAVTVANLTTLIGQPITFAAVGGTLSGAQTSIQAAGTATATYTATAAAASNSVTGKVDSAPSSGSVNTDAITVNKAGTTAAITTDLSAATVTGQSYTVAFSVAAAFGLTPTAAAGTVQVSDGSQTCSGAINAGGTGSCSITSTSAGAKTLTATYQGDSNFNASAASPGISHTVNKASTTVVLGTSGTPSVFGQSVTFTATISVTAPGSGSPTGNVTFQDGGVNIGTCASQGIVASVATCTISTLSVASHPITATYNGDSNFLASPASNTVSQVVNKASTSVVLGTSGTPSVFGQSVTFTATISVSNPGSGSTTGNVTFQDGGVNIGTCATQSIVANVATCAISTLSVATHPITATYNGDGNFNTSTSNNISQVVNKASTSVVLGTSGTPSVFGQSVTFTATISVSNPGSGSTTGNVTFKDGVVNIGTCATQSILTNVATCTISTLSVASHSITATYNGDGNFTTSTSNTVSQVVNKASTSVVLGTSGTPSVFGQSVTFTATINITSPGSGSTTGNVTFKDGVVNIGTCATQSILTNVASCTISNLSVASHSITATYNGDSNFTTSTSNTVSQTVSQAGTSVVLGTSGTPSVFGQSVTFTATINVSAPGSGAPTGSVAFKDNGVNIGTCATQAIAANAATCTISALTVATHPITATYNGDSNFTTSTSNTVSQVVNPVGSPVSVSGHVFTLDGHPLRNTNVTITNTTTNAFQTTVTDSFGNYQFASVVTGATYTISISSKHYKFLTQTYTINAAMTNVDFTGDE